MSLRRNATHAFIGVVLPTLILFISFPFLVRKLGDDAFGVYVLVASIGGLATLLDLGFSAATTKFVAEDLGRGLTAQAADCIVTSAAIYTALGIVGMALIAALAPVLIDLIRVPVELRDASIDAFRAASLQLPAFMAASVTVAALKGLQRFDLSSLLLSALACLTHGGAALAVTVFGLGLRGLAVVGVFATFSTLLIGTAVLHGAATSKGLALRAGRLRWQEARRMFGFGVFVAVTSLVIVGQNQVLRYFLGAVLGPAAVGTYHIAATLPGKITGAVSAVAEVLFPMVAGSADREEVRRAYIRMLAGCTILACVGLLPLLLVPTIPLQLWLGDQATIDLVAIVQILAIGSLINATTPPPYHLANGLGRPSVNTAVMTLLPVVHIVCIAALWGDALTLRAAAWAATLAYVVQAAVYHVLAGLLILPSKQKGG